MAENLDKIISFIEKDLSKISRQYEWDNSGKQVYLGNKYINRVSFALDASYLALESSVKKGCELLITHHPLFFDSFKKIDVSGRVGEKIIFAVQSGLNILSYHTNFDLSDYSTNDYFAEQLGAKIVDTLSAEGKENYYKFVVYTPENYADKIIDEIDNVGGGAIGKYSKCTFSTRGTGTFFPGPETKPFLGKQGKLERVDEYRLETIVKEEYLQDLITNVINTHPYEEVGYDIYKLENSKTFGLGRICELESDTSISDFILSIQKKINIKHLRHNISNMDEKVKKFAIVTGSGSFFWKICKAKGVNLFITGDMKYHDALDAKEEGINIIDAGHFETEKMYMKYVGEALNNKFNLEVVLLDEESTIKYVGEK